MIKDQYRFDLLFFSDMRVREKIYLIKIKNLVAFISAKKHKRQRRKRQSVAAKREKSQTPKFITAIQT